MYKRLKIIAACWLILLPLNLEASPADSTVLLRYYAGSSGIYVQEGTDRVEYSGSQVARTERMPGFNGGGLQEFRCWAEQEFESRCALKFPELVGMLTSAMPSLIILEFTLDSSGATGNVRLLTTANRKLGDVAVQVVNAAREWRPAMRLAAGPDTEQWHPVPVQIWLILDTNKLWNSSNSTKNSCVSH